MREREKKYKSKGGRLNQKLQIDMGLDPSKKAPAPDAEKLLSEIRKITEKEPQSENYANPQLWTRKRSKRRRH